MLRIITKTSTRYFGHCERNNKPISLQLAQLLDPEGGLIDSFSFSTVQNKELFALKSSVCFEGERQFRIFFGVHSFEQNKQDQKLIWLTLLKLKLFYLRLKRKI